MAANDNVMQELHAQVARSLTDAVQPREDADGVIVPPSAAHLAAAIAFLKANNITADANTNKELLELRESLAARRKKKPNHLALVEAEDTLAERLSFAGGLQ